MLHHEIIENEYYIYDEDNKPVFKITLMNTFPNNQVVIETDKEVYSGPLQFLSFCDVKEEQ